MFKSWQAHNHFRSSRPPGRSLALVLSARLPSSCNRRAGVRELSGAMIPMLD
jgi:hypothetical protein